MIQTGGGGQRKFSYMDKGAKKVFYTGFSHSPPPPLLINNELSLSINSDQHVTCPYIISYRVVVKKCPCGDGNKVNSLSLKISLCQRKK